MLSSYALLCPFSSGNSRCLSTGMNALRNDNRAQTMSGNTVSEHTDEAYTRPHFPLIFLVNLFSLTFFLPNERSENPAGWHYGLLTYPFAQQEQYSEAQSINPLFRVHLARAGRLNLQDHNRGARHPGGCTGDRKNNLQQYDSTTTLDCISLKGQVQSAKLQEGLYPGAVLHERSIADANGSRAGRGREAHGKIVGMLSFSEHRWLSRCLPVRCAVTSFPLPKILPKSLFVC